MAYILGFTYADGSIYKNTLAWDIQVRDCDVLKKINLALESNYIIERRKHSVRLRINNRRIIDSLFNLRIEPKKRLRELIPVIPKKYARHFVRGFMEGDGWIVVNNVKQEGVVGFSSGSNNFLYALNTLIDKHLSIKARIRQKMKITPKGVVSKTKSMEFYCKKACILADWLYLNLNKDDIYMDRKYNKYVELKKMYKYLNSGTRVVRKIQKERKENIKQILSNMLSRGMDGVQISKELCVHSSSIYRWFHRYGLKY